MSIILLKTSLSSFVIPSCLVRTRIIKNTAVSFLTFPSRTCSTKIVTTFSFFTEQCLVWDKNMFLVTSWTTSRALSIWIKPKALPAVGIYRSAGVWCHRSLMHSKLLSIASTLSFFASPVSCHYTRKRFTYCEKPFQQLFRIDNRKYFAALLTEYERKARALPNQIKGRFPVSPWK